MHLKNGPIHSEMFCRLCNKNNFPLAWGWGDENGILICGAVPFVMAFCVYYVLIIIVSPAGVWQEVQPHMALHCWEELRQLCDARDEAFHLLLPGPSGHSAFQVRLNSQHAPQKLLLIQPLIIRATLYIRCHLSADMLSSWFPACFSQLLFITYNTTTMGGWRFSHAWTGGAVHKECKTNPPCLLWVNICTSDRLTTPHNFWMFFLFCFCCALMRGSCTLFHMLYNNLFFIELKWATDSFCWNAFNFQCQLRLNKYAKTVAYT